MDNYNLLNNINNNFNKLFTMCKNGITYTPLLFNSSYDIDALIVLNQIVDIILQTRTNSTKSMLLGSTLNQIIIIKCREFTEKFPWNSNLDNFIASFYTYINNVIDSEYHMN